MSDSVQGCLEATNRDGQIAGDAAGHVEQSRFRA
jgi:hypothetical protein